VISSDMEELALGVSKCLQTRETFVIEKHVKFFLEKTTKMQTIVIAEKFDISKTLSHISLTSQCPGSFEAESICL